MLNCNLSSDDLPWHWVINEDEDSAVHFIGSIIYLSLLGWEMRGHQNNDIKAGSWLVELDTNPIRKFVKISKSGRRPLLSPGLACLSSVPNVKALEVAFNQEKVLVGASSVITNLRMDLRFKLYWLVIIFTWWHSERGLYVEDRLVIIAKICRYCRFGLRFRHLHERSFVCFLCTYWARNRIMWWIYHLLNMKYSAKCCNYH